MAIQAKIEKGGAEKDQSGRRNGLNRSVPAVFASAAIVVIAVAVGLCAFVIATGKPGTVAFACATIALCRTVAAVGVGAVGVTSVGVGALTGCGHEIDVG